MRTITAAMLLIGGCDKTITLVDENNFSYTGTVDIPKIETSSGTDLFIDWGELSSDIRCHELDPAEDIDNVSLIRFPYLTQEEVEDKINNDNLQQVDQDGYVEYTNEGGTTVNLSELSFFGTPIDVPTEYNADGGTYLVIHATGNTPGVGSRMLAFLTPSEDSENTDVNIPSGCGVLDFSADLTSLTPTSIPADGPWFVDWRALTTNGLGNAFDLSNVDGLMLGFYEGLTTEDLQTQFLDLELIATTLYEMDLSGGSAADLAEMSDGTNNFSGFSADGVWILGLMCSTCANPAPLFLTVLEPVE